MPVVAGCARERKGFPSLRSITAEHLAVTAALRVVGDPLAVDERGHVAYRRVAFVGDVVLRPGTGWRSGQPQWNATIRPNSTVTVRRRYATVGTSGQPGNRRRLSF
jgi:hypothetical protein